MRIVSRVTGCGDNILDAGTKKSFRMLLDRTLPADRPGDFNQALMDLGAMICLPGGEPLCKECPCRSFCAACLQGRQRELPVRLKKTARRIEKKTVFLLLRGDEAALRQRPASGLLAGLWEYPHVEGMLDEAEAAAQLESWHVMPHRWVKRLAGHHIFTHIRWEMTGYVVEVTGEGQPDWLWADRDERSRRAVPSAFMKWTKELPEEKND